MSGTVSTSSSAAGRLGALGFVGLGLTTMSALMFEILVTRIFSVTIWYHFAFVAISIAMFGTSVGALLVYLLPSFFHRERARRQLSVFSLLYAVSIPLSLAALILVRFDIGDASLAGIARKIVVFGSVAIPFTLSGVAICLVLTRFSRQVSRLYAVDLLGAAAGCIAIVIALDTIGDASTVLILLSAIAALGSACFAREAKSRLFTATLVLAATALAVAVTSGAMLEESRKLIGIQWVKGKQEREAVYERWSSYSRVTVRETEDDRAYPGFWGMSPVFERKFPRETTRIRQLLLLIDSTAGTPLTHFEGDPGSIDFLKYDLVNLAHQLRTDADVAIIGVGGGRDVLSAIAFDQRSVHGIEINNDIVRAVNGPFREYTGDLGNRPGVEIVNDEARSWLARSDQRFDIIQASLIDTWAATAAGAFVLSENSLYTTEAWEMFLDRLKPDGLLTFSRWYADDYPDEMYRLMSLAIEALKATGAEDPGRHIVVAAVDTPIGIGAGTMLVSRSPFAASDLDRLERVAAELEFSLVFTPRTSLDPGFVQLVDPRTSARFIAEYPRDLTAPTDNHPFFFNMLRLRDSFSAQLAGPAALTFNLQAVSILGSLFVAVLTLALAFILLPLFLTRRNVELRSGKPMLIYFAAIGLGYILVEVSQLQRLVVFLGHPTYSLSVVLFTMLVSSGLGSSATNAILSNSPPARSTTRLAWLVGVLCLYSLFSPLALGAFRDASTLVRIAVAGGTLFPIGFFMGMAFPLGMKFAEARMPSLTAWFWGINGVGSTLSSVLALVVSLSLGISAAFWFGVSCYVFALASFAWCSRNLAPGPTGGGLAHESPDAEGFRPAGDP